MTTDSLQEVIELLDYAINHRDWNSAEEALELLKGDHPNSEFDDESD
jgi:hypothetical protein